MFQARALQRANHQSREALVERENLCQLKLLQA